MDENFYRELSTKKIPILILDNKWHQLFEVIGKTKRIEKLEEELTECLKRQGFLNTDIKDMKKLKSKLMKSIVENMEVADDKKQLKRMEENQRLILEINEKTGSYEDELLELPRKIKEINFELMVESMEYCYTNLIENERILKEINSWIKSVRIELKKNLLRKQDKEELNTKMYAYMHDIFGAEIVDSYDKEFRDYK